MFGIMAVLLGSGDAFHLVPRAVALCTTGLENFTVQMGLGKWIVLDSCGELTYKMKESGIYHTAVLSMLVDGDTILDDESFDRKDFLKRVAA